MSAHLLRLRGRCCGSNLEVVILHILHRWYRIGCYCLCFFPLLSFAAEEIYHRSTPSEEPGPQTGRPQPRSLRLNSFRPGLLPPTYCPVEKFDRILDGFLTSTLHHQVEFLRLPLHGFDIGWIEHSPLLNIQRRSDKLLDDPLESTDIESYINRQIVYKVYCAIFAWSI